MACCILAALIFAQITATIRRWAVFWGLLAPGEFDNPDTIMRRVRLWLARPAVRAGFAAVLALEAVTFGVWVIEAHGQHIARLADMAMARLDGRRVIYAPACGHGRGQAPVRLVVADLPAAAPARPDVVIR